jgi:hypothetical protein
MPRPVSGPGVSRAGSQEVATRTASQDISLGRTASQDMMKRTVSLDAGRPPSGGVRAARTASMDAHQVVARRPLSDVQGAAPHHEVVSGAQGAAAPEGRPGADAAPVAIMHGAHARAEPGVLSEQKAASPGGNQGSQVDVSVWGGNGTPALRAAGTAHRSINACASAHMLDAHKAQHQQHSSAAGSLGSQHQTPLNRQRGAVAQTEAQSGAAEPEGSSSVELEGSASGSTSVLAGATSGYVGTMESEGDGAWWVTESTAQHTQHTQQPRHTWSATASKQGCDASQRASTDEKAASCGQAPVSPEVPGSHTQASMHTGAMKQLGDAGGQEATARWGTGHMAKWYMKEPAPTSGVFVNDWEREQATGSNPSDEAPAERESQMGGSRMGGPSFAGNAVDDSVPLDAFSDLDLSQVFPEIPTEVPVRSFILQVMRAAMRSMHSTVAWTAAGNGHPLR